MVEDIAVSNCTDGRKLPIEADETYVCALCFPKGQAPQRAEVRIDVVDGKRKATCSTSSCHFSGLPYSRQCTIQTRGIGPSRTVIFNEGGDDGIL